MLEFLLAPYEAVAALMVAGGQLVGWIFVSGIVMWALIFERIYFFQFTLPKMTQEALAIWHARPERNSWAAHQIRKTLISRLSSGMSANLPMVKVLVPGFYARQDTRTPVRFAIVSLIVGMGLSLVLFAYAQVHAIEGAHVGLAISTSLTACINGGLLYARLRRDGIYRAAPGWGVYGLRLLLANAAMAAAVLALAGDLDGWLAAGEWARGGRMLGLVAVAMVVYFGVLAASGLRVRHFRDGRRG